MTQHERSVWVEYLGPAECWGLVRSQPAGRLGVLVDSAPEIYPVNHVVDRDAIVFRTNGGTKWRGLDRNPSVCFEVDEIAAVTATGWSVLVKGRAVELTDPEDLRLAELLPLDPWLYEDGTHFVRIVPTDISGRRIGRNSRHDDASGARSIPPAS